MSENTQQAKRGWAKVIRNFLIYIGIWVLISFFASLVFSTRPVFEVVNNTGVTWDELDVLWMEGIGSLPSIRQYDEDVPPGGKVDVDRTAPWYAKPEDFSLRLTYLQKVAWGIAVRYPGEKRPINLIYSYVDNIPPYLFFWNIELYRITVHEGNGVQLERRWW